MVRYNVTGFLVPRGMQQLFRSRQWRRNTAIRPDIESLSSHTKERPPPPPDQSYLQLITDQKNRDLWINTDILQEEPFLTITQPICALAKLANGVMTLLQLVFMICLSIYHMPTFCSLSSEFKFNLTTIQCNSSDVMSDHHASHKLWLIWPLVVSLDMIVDIVRRKILVSLFISLNFMFILCVILCQSLSYSVSSYLALTSLVHLFGWLFALSLFIRTL